jgi:hypothetical protein
MSNDFKPKAGSAFLFKKPLEEVDGNQPQFNGYIVLDDDLIAEAKADPEFMLEIAGWKKETSNGKSMLSCKVQKKYRKEEGAEAPKQQVNSEF